MAQPKEPPLSIRPPPAMLKRVEAFAAEREVTRHLALIMLIERGLNAPEPAQLAVKVRRVPLGPPATWPSGAVVMPDHKEDPGLEAPRTTVNVQLGPARPKPGDRLKKGKAK